MKSCQHVTANAQSKLHEHIEQRSRGDNQESRRMWIRGSKNPYITLSQSGSLDDFESIHHGDLHPRIRDHLRGDQDACHLVQIQACRALHPSPGVGRCIVALRTACDGNAVHAKMPCCPSRLMQVFCRISLKCSLGPPSKEHA